MFDGFWKWIFGVKKLELEFVINKFVFIKIEEEVLGID